MKSAGIFIAQSGAYSLIVSIPMFILAGAIPTAVAMARAGVICAVLGFALFAIGVVRDDR